MLLLQIWAKMEFITASEKVSCLDSASDTDIVDKENFDESLCIDSNTIYYGVYIPSEVQIGHDGCFVFQDKLEAIKLVKKYKKARFKSFKYYHEAAEFALHGSEIPNNESTTEEQSAQKSNSEDQPLGEKSLFKGPKSQDLVKLRKGIETGDIQFVQNLIWENPRYLISSGDTPSILQEGFRYNALHVAAKAKNHDMAELILSTISNIQFIKLLYGDDSYQDAEERIKILLDLYLNTPDKGLNETPLHFASKFGADKVIEVLVSFPMCDKTIKNKYGKKAIEIICDRSESIGSVSVRNRIAMLLEDNFYVPVLRAEDNCMTPEVGEPFSQTKPPNFNTDPLKPRLEIHAYAGPMNKDKANKFRKIWKTPPRSLIQNSGSNKSTNSFMSPADLKFKDPDKGLERIGRELAAKYDVGWKEYWPFLSSFLDLSSQEGLEQLEKYLSYRTLNDSSNILSPILSYSVRSEENSNYQKSPLSPLSELCSGFENCNLNSPKVSGITSKANLWIDLNLNATNKSKVKISGSPVFKESNPHLCIEKSCQVFANRISNDILYLVDCDNSNAILETQIKQLQILICSFFEDGRFNNVDFRKVHCRLGCLIASKLKQTLQLLDAKSDVRETLQCWLENCSKNYDCFSSDDESVCSGGLNLQQKKATPINKQLVCLLQCILIGLANDVDVNVNVTTEEESINAWVEAKPCSCVWQASFKRKDSSIKKSSSAKSIKGLDKEDTVSRRLIFEDDVSLRTTSNTIQSPQLQQMELGEMYEESDSSDEEFYTPSSSPTFFENKETQSDEEEIFEESFLPENDIFIEGNIPTKMDKAVFNALKNAEDKLNPKDYPYIYKWYHAVKCYSSAERDKWKNLSTPTPVKTLVSRSFHSRDAEHQQSSSPVTPPKSWLRITGINSPSSLLSEGTIFSNVKKK